jgi:hypothetical protein
VRPGGHDEGRGFRRVRQHQRDRRLIQEPGDALGDGVEDRLQRLAPGDRPLDGEQCLQQGLPDAEHLQQFQSLPGLAGAFLAQRPLGREYP